MDKIIKIDDVEEKFMRKMIGNQNKVFRLKNISMKNLKRLKIVMKNY